MASLPVFFPGLFPADAADGSNTSALWLGLMGRVNAVLGGLILFRLTLLPVVIRALAWNPARILRTPAEILRPAFRDHRQNRAKADRRLAA